VGFTADEREIMKEVRWWSAAEVEASEERIFPEGLAGRMREQSGRVNDVQRGRDGNEL
jgi:hypothetical protein